MEQLPADPYAAHELQISGQTGLLRRLWNKPTFSLRDKNGRILHDNLTFPQICREHLDLAFPDSVRDVSLEGWLLCLSMKEARPFGPYGYDAESLANIFTQARAGFVHAKVFVVDDSEAVVGTINLDYRSLYHHFENAVWMKDTACIPAIEKDFQKTLEFCRDVEPTRESIWEGKVLLHLAGILLKVIAPLL